MCFNTTVDIMQVAFLGQKGSQSQNENLVLGLRSWAQPIVTPGARLENHITGRQSFPHQHWRGYHIRSRQHHGSGYYLHRKAKLHGNNTLGSNMATDLRLTVFSNDAHDELTPCGSHYFFGHLLWQLPRLSQGNPTHGPRRRLWHGPSPLCGMLHVHLSASLLCPRGLQDFSSRAVPLGLWWLDGTARRYLVVGGQTQSSPQTLR